MNVNNPRIDPRNGYYTTELWENKPELLIFNPHNKNKFIIDWDKLYTYKTPYKDRIFTDYEYNVMDFNGVLELKWIGRTL